MKREKKYVGEEYVGKYCLRLELNKPEMEIGSDIFGIEEFNIADRERLNLDDEEQFCLLESVLRADYLHLTEDGTALVLKRDHKNPEVFAPAHVKVRHRDGSPITSAIEVIQELNRYWYIVIAAVAVGESRVKNKNAFQIKVGRKVESEPLIDYSMLEGGDE